MLLLFVLIAVTLFGDRIVTNAFPRGVVPTAIVMGEGEITLLMAIRRNRTSRDR
jgi:hypothetical protein